MSEIDWSKAPEGATHFGVENEFYFSAWYKVEGEQILSYTEDGSMWREATDSCVFPKVSSLSARPEQWSGEGLPPVGTVCEFAGFNPEETLPSDPMIGDRVTVIAHFKSGSIDVAAFTFFAPPEFEYLQVGQGAHGCFRPIRTPEQIEAEKREEEVKAMMALNPDENPNQALTKWLCEALYDAGYRKQEAS